MGNKLNWTADRKRVRVSTTHKTGGQIGANGYGTYQVRYATPKQQLFITSLLEVKDHSFNDIDVTTLNVQGAGDLITKLLKLPNKQGVITPASDRQISYVKSLIENKEGGFTLLNDYLQRRNVQEVEQLDKSDVSELIGVLKSTADKQVPITITEVGAYLFDETIYSIRKGSYSKDWQVWSFDKGQKKYARNSKEIEKKVLTSIDDSNRLTLEQAVKYSAQTGICCHCGRTLTVLRSVAGGIGPVCAKKYH